MTTGIPVQESFYGCYVRNSDGHECTEKFLRYIMKDTSRLEQARGLSLSRPVSIAARASYYMAFGILPDCQRVLEQQYQRLRIEALSQNLCDRSDEPTGNIIHEYEE